MSSKLSSRSRSSKKSQNPPIFDISEDDISEDDISEDDISEDEKSMEFLKNRPTRNYECKIDSISKHDALNTCCANVGLSSFKLLKHIGSGHFGEVYSGTAMKDYSKDTVVSYKIPQVLVSRPIKIAVKVAKLDPDDENDTDDDEDDLNNAFLEVEYSRYMGEVGIGPEIYHTFYTKIYQGKKAEISQYIVMEPLTCF